MAYYWDECIADALEEAGIKATPEQIAHVGESVRIAHENYDMAHGHDCIPNPLKLENDDLTRRLVAERAKVTCKICNGSGRTITFGGTFQSESQCWKCHGEGRH